jgi:feruloyl esterase
MLSLSVPNTTIESAVDTPAGAVSNPLGGPPTPVPESCRVQATVSTPGVVPADQIHVYVWLPVSGWNGRFQGVGGAGYQGGTADGLAGALAGGYAAASTDTGHSNDDGFASFALSPWALKSTGELNWPLIEDFSYRGLHDLAVVGKAVTAAYYGTEAKYSYWNGCSTGGRQGLSEAQRYPDDFNGILAAAPAINWQKFIPAEFWPQLVMLQEGDVLPQCKFDAFQAAAVQACDAVGDGVADGVIGDPSKCAFDPASLVGASTACGAITTQDAAVVAKIFAGPRTTSGDFLWYGLMPGTPFSGVAGTTTSGSTTTLSPFPIALEHLGTWTQQAPWVGDPSPPVGVPPTWDWRTTTYDEFERLFQRSVEVFSSVIGTDEPDLSPFKEAGGKLIIWHGLADELIFPQGSIDYYTRVVEAMGGEGNTTDFARLFLAPGVNHCGGPAGVPQPDVPLSQLVAWVEQGNAPAQLNGVVQDPSTGAVIETRPICMYPDTAEYRGSGPRTKAASFACAQSSEGVTSD